MQEECLGYNNALFSGLTTIELAKIINDLIIPNRELCGIYHISGNTISKFDLLKLINEIYTTNIVLKKNSKVVIDRSLNSNKFKKQTGYFPLKWKDQILEMKDYYIMFKNSSLLITGGTGSFGYVAVKNFLSKGVKEIRIFSRDEKKQDDMRQVFDDVRLKFIIGDVRDYQSINKAMKNVEYVFHAAALKQVPSCEFYPMEAVKTNILGSENVIQASINCNVKKVVMLSTDKAVYPINAMGLSKSIMEKCMIAQSRMLNTTKETILCATRYGNVMASRGSVIPLFINQLLNNKNLTITDPKMTRFLMSLDDSFDLVDFAFKNGEQGDIFVQKGQSSTILDLANALKELFKKDNIIDIKGTRHGEKLFETLISREEMVNAKKMDNYYKIPADNRDLNYNKYFINGEEKISFQDDYTSHNTKRLNIEEIKSLLLTVEYVRDKLNA